MGATRWSSHAEKGGDSKPPQRPIDTPTTGWQLARICKQTATGSSAWRHARRNKRGTYRRYPFPQRHVMTRAFFQASAHVAAIEESTRREFRRRCFGEPEPACASIASSYTSRSDTRKKYLGAKAALTQKPRLSSPVTRPCGCALCFLSEPECNNGARWHGRPPHLETLRHVRSDGKGLDWAFCGAPAELVRWQRGRSLRCLADTVMWCGICWQMIQPTHPPPTIK